MMVFDARELGRAGMDGLEIWHYIPHRIKNRTRTVTAEREIERGLKLMMMAWLFFSSSSFFFFFVCESYERIGQIRRERDGEDREREEGGAVSYSLLIMSLS
jgi:hypothetical protein